MKTLGVLSQDSGQPENLYAALRRIADAFERVFVLHQDQPEPDDRARAAMKRGLLELV